MDISKIKFTFGAALEYSGIRGFIFKGGLPRPLKVYFEMCPDCNFRCRHCDCSSISPVKAETGYWLKALEDIHGWFPGFTLGFGYAEPLLEPGIFEVIKKASSLSVPSLFTTNGSLIDTEMTVRLKDSGLLNLYISLDGMAARTHDRLRGEGSYDKIMRALPLLRAAGGPRIYIATVISAFNLGEIIPLTRWAAQSGLAGITFQPVEKRTDLCDEMWPADFSAVSRVVDELLELKRKGFPIRNSSGHIRLFRQYFGGGSAPRKAGACFSGRTLRLKADGGVYSCPFMEPLGNIKKDAIQQIWASEKARGIREEILNCRRAGCYLLNCNFGPSVSALFGDLAGYLSR